MDEQRKSTQCRLIRAGGAEWSVHELELSETPPRAVGVPVAGNGEGGVDPRELVLTNGDRLEWRRDDGTLAWAACIPLRGETSDAADAASRRPSAGAA